MTTYGDEAVVLRTIKLGEADRIVTLLTPGNGKVRAVAKGVRKTKSRLRGRVDVLTQVKVLCWRGRELDVINQAEVVDHFKAIRADLDRLAVAQTMLEVVDHLALEREPMPELYKLLVGALRTLDGAASPVLLASFLWKALALEGVGPSPDRCAVCGQVVELVAFDPGEGGLLCRSDRRGQAVAPETVALLGRVLGGDLRGALAEPPSRATAELERLATLATEYHLDRRVRSAHHSGEPSFGAVRAATERREPPEAEAPAPPGDGAAPAAAAGDWDARPPASTGEPPPRGRRDGG